MRVWGRRLQNSGAPIVYQKEKRPSVVRTKGPSGMGWVSCSSSSPLIGSISANWGAAATRYRSSCCDLGQSGRIAHA